MPPDALAARLPFDVLHHIFLLLQTGTFEERGEHAHGGRLVHWDSNEELRSLPLVCSGWQEAANAVLYHSMALRSGAAAVKLRATLQARPELAELVRWVVVGDADEQAGGGESADEEQQGWLQESQELIAALQALPNVEHLLLRPLHPSTRPTLLTFFARRRRRLKSLVLIARDLAGVPGFDGLIKREDSLLILDGLERLDVDVWFPPTRLFITSTEAVCIPPQLSLTHLCLDADYPTFIVYSLICPTLTHLHLYFEHHRSAQEAAVVLSQATVLRHLHYVCNPPLEVLDNTLDPSPGAQKVLDLLLPSLRHLETLHVSATDISPSFLAHPPPKLHHVIIQVCNSPFDPEEVMLRLLRDSAVDTRALRVLEVRDSGERWKARGGEMVEAGERRGMRFVVVSDEEVGDD